MKISETLIKAKEIIYDENNWTVGATARNKYNHSTEPVSDEAVKFCLEGAICRAAEINYIGSAGVFARNYTEKTYNELPWRINDNINTKHKDILKLFDEIIEAAKQKEMEKQLEPA